MSDENSLSHFVLLAKRFPILESGEEFKLAKRWHEEQHEESAHALLQSHLRLVVKIASGYRGYGLPAHDLLAEGSIGMMQALKRFEPDKGFRFSTYAMWWIDATIKEYILKSWSLVKIGTTASQKKLFFGLRALKNKLMGQGSEENRDGILSEEMIQEVSQKMNVTREDVIMMDQRMQGQEFSLNSVLNIDTGGEWQDWLLDEADNQEERFAHQQEFEKRHALLKEAFKTLEKREFDVFMARRLEEPPKTLEELSEVYQISRERIRQIEMKAFEKIQKDVHKSARKIGILN
ncbi:RNA polymerase sigma 70 [Candidatus Paracaedimonas acanthamoebae]|nr:RNA polymerase sigma 70 [Candidatus Paracaedimonas acanthamoebae]